MSGAAWWTGGVKDKNEVGWIWDNSNTEMGYTNWDPYQDNTGDEKCVMLSESVQWKRHSCTNNVKIICEMI